MADVNWEKIKLEYITTDTSQTKLAKKYGVPLSNIARRCTKEKWVELRDNYKRDVTVKTAKKSANREANRLARLMDTTSKAIDVAVKAFGDPDQFNRYIVERKEKYAFPTAGDGSEDEEAALVSERQWAEERIFSKIDTKALKDMTAVLKDITALMRDFYNLPTPAQAEAQRIAAERLELERRKADAAENDTDGIEVTFNAGEEEWNE